MSEFPGPWLDARERPPEADGWYAVLFCWDPVEGIFPGGAYWEDNSWGRASAVSWRSPAPFDSEIAATDWAYQHDPDA